jgi:guanosine-3',5'-bis(diphosphate) 3'-pyrophosphohydrolase
MDSPGQTYRPLLEAVSFAARAHRHQLRKDDKTPYAAHVFRVCLVLRHVFGISDPAALTAAALHDTIEDTTTDYDNLAEHFGDEVAGWVALLSKDKRQPEEAREEAYLAALAGAPWQVKACKLADLFDNLMDSSHFRPEQQARTIKKAKDALKALDAPDLPGPVRQAWETVSRLVKEMEPKKRGQTKA